MPRASAHARAGTTFGRVGQILAAKSGPPDHFLPRTKFFVTHPPDPLTLSVTREINFNFAAAL